MKVLYEAFTADTGTCMSCTCTQLCNTCHVHISRNICMANTGGLHE